MRIATLEDREKAINILYRAFKKTPGVVWIVKQDKCINDRIKAVCAYCFDTVLPIKGAFITSDGKGVSLLYRLKDKKLTVRDLINQAILAYKAIGVRRAKEIIRREKYIKQHRPEGDYLYFWMVAVDTDVKGIDTMKEITYWAQELSNKMNIPLLAETTMEKNKVVYERYGYQVYHTWDVPKKDFKVYFMIKYPKGYKQN